MERPILMNDERLDDFGRQLAQFAVRAGGSCTEEFYHDAFLNIYACLLSGAASGMGDSLVKFYAEEAGYGRFSPVGREEKMSIASCVSTDAFHMACLAYDDIQFTTTLHPAGPVMAAILGVARKKKVTGLRALQAFQIGMESECRMAYCIFGDNTGVSGGWLPTGVVGGIGAASAVGFLEGFDARQMRMAQALAGSVASGNRGTHGSSAAGDVFAFSAESGYRAAYLIKSGQTCNPNALTGRNGLILQLAPDPDLISAMDGIGDTYLCETTSCKPYRFGFISFASLDCCRQLNRYQEKTRKQVRAIQTFVGEKAYILGDRPDPQGVLEAEISLQYLISMAVARPELISRPLDEHFMPGEFDEVGFTVSLTVDKSLSDQQAYMDVLFEDGTRCDFHCESASGSENNLMKHDDIIAKFRFLTQEVIGNRETEVLLRRIQSLEDEKDISDLLIR